MHIKQITVSNFRSFRNQNDDGVVPFSSSTNVVIGRNGSGKSNLFDALQFALLAPRFANLKAENRQALLHEGSGRAAVQAYVEVVFDNSDGRVVDDSGQDEVILRRTITAKKDEFFLQHKRVTKTEVQSLLEGAGLSKSNPNMIQQGQIQNICVMSDKARLELLQEVAGTTVYDHKKREATLQMHTTARNLETCTELLDEIAAKLDRLQQETNELQQYQVLDKQRKTLEYVYHDVEMRKACKILDALEVERTAHSNNIVKLNHQVDDTMDQRQHVQARLQRQTVQQQRAHECTRDAEQHKTMAVQHATKLQHQVKELQEALHDTAQQLRANATALQETVQDIAAAETQLSTVAPQYEAQNKQYQDLQHRRQEIARQLESVYAKQGRAAQFRSRQERDAFLQRQVDELHTAVQGKQTTLHSTHDKLAAGRRQLTADQEAHQQATVQVQTTSQSLHKATKELDRVTQSRLQTHAHRQECWRELEHANQDVQLAGKAWRSHDLRRVMPRATAQGLEALETLVQKQQLVRGQQYFGLVMENFTLQHTKYQTAVEVAAQNALFHVIVDTDKTAANLMDELEKHQLGRVTFLPLNQLRLETVDYPNSTDVVPMLERCLQFDKKVDKAMQHVFAKKLLARSAEVASRWSVQCQMDAITLDGDLCSRKGALTGGYVDVSKSRLQVYYQQQAAKDELHACEQKAQELAAKAEKVDQEVSDVVQEMQRLEASKVQLEHAKADAEQLVKSLATKVELHQKHLKTWESQVQPLERDLSLLEAEIKTVQDEMGTELTDRLTEADQNLIKALKQQQEELAVTIEGKSQQVAQLGLERQKLQSLLEDNLYKRRHELEQGDEANMEGPGLEVARAEIAQDLEERQAELDEALKVKQDVERQLADARQKDEELRNETVAAKNELEQLQTVLAQQEKAVEEEKDKQARLTAKLYNNTRKRDDAGTKIQQLGSLPPPAELKKFANKSTSELMKLLEGVAQQLKKYSHVNKKAYDQFVNFNDQQEALLKRKAELDKEADKVQELIESLDRQKDEAINRTFRGVSAHFQDVFQELVPSGAGELIMRTAIDEPVSTDVEQSSDEDAGSPAKKDKAVDPNNPDVSLYRGVSIKVRFSQVGENYMMSQLSGGQKAVVAMALIFAIQRCDPAPFYVFDELDQALDSAYRSAVANLIKRQAVSKDTPTQFIVSTFRPELVQVANRCYGISLQSKVSSLHHLSKKDALHFIANLMSEEEAVGEVSTVATSKHSLGSRSKRRRKGDESSDEDDAGPTAPTGGDAIEEAMTMDENEEAQTEGEADED